MKTDILLVYADRDEAYEKMIEHNRAHSDNVSCLVEHPEGWAVCDLESVIEMQIPYTIAY